jgi:hypothetical protein
MGESAEVVDLNAAALCQNEASINTFEEYCDLRQWSRFMVSAQSLSWTKRRAEIDKRGDTPKTMLEQILLSQAQDTPYRNRLRAQNWIRTVSESMDETMVSALNTLIRDPSQQILELESAITLLSRLNAQQEKTMKELEDALVLRSEEIEKQRSQVEQLLKIEAKMSEQKRSN